jgi:hypothetical protein
MEWKPGVGRQGALVQTKVQERALRSWFALNPAWGEQRKAKSWEASTALWWNKLRGVVLLSAAVLLAVASAVNYRNKHSQ